MVKQGKAEIPGITDKVLLKHATKIRSFFNLGKENDHEAIYQGMSRSAPYAFSFVAHPLPCVDPRSSASSPPCGSSAGATSALSSTEG